MFKKKRSKSQQSIGKLVKSPLGQKRPNPKAKTPLTPPLGLHDKNSHNRMQKQQNTVKTCTSNKNIINEKQSCQCKNKNFL